MAAVKELAPDVGIHAACAALGVVRSSFYRRQQPAPVAESRAASGRALNAAERETVLAHLHEERFQDRSPAAVQATLLDEGVYRCSTRTMYRILAEQGETRERRDQCIHPVYHKHELLATAPNELWSWDITKLLGPAKWTYFYLYVILDVFSRYVVGWMVAHRESAEMARKLIEDTCLKQQIEAGQLTIHADRGSSMTSKPVGFLLADLGLTKTHSRPHVSDEQSLLGKSVSHHEIQTRFPGPLWLDPGQPRPFSALLLLVQRGASPFRYRTAHPGHGSLRASRGYLPKAATRTQCRLPGAPGALRPVATQTTLNSKGGLD
jgi:putative transposase